MGDRHSDTRFGRFHIKLTSLERGMIFKSIVQGIFIAHFHLRHVQIVHNPDSILDIKSQDMVQGEMGKLTGGMNIPGFM